MRVHAPKIRLKKKPKGKQEKERDQIRHLDKTLSGNRETDSTAEENLFSSSDSSDSENSVKTKIADIIDETPQKPKKFLSQSRPLFGPAASRQSTFTDTKIPALTPIEDFSPGSTSSSSESSDSSDDDSASSSTSDDEDEDDLPLAVLRSKKRRRIRSRQEVEAKKMMDYMTSPLPGISFRDYYNVKSSVNEDSADRVEKQYPKKRWLENCKLSLPKSDTFFEKTTKTKTKPKPKPKTKPTADIQMDSAVHCQVFERADDSWKRIDNTNNNNKALVALQDCSILISSGSCPTQQIGLQKSGTFYLASSKFLQLENYGKTFGFGFASAADCDAFQKLLEGQGLQVNSSLLTEKKFATIGMLKSRVENLETSKEAANVRQKELEDQNNALATKNNMLEGEVTKMRRLLQEASRELQRKDHEQFEERSLVYPNVDVLKEAKKLLENVLSGIESDRDTKTESINTDP